MEMLFRMISVFLALILGGMALKIKVDQNPTERCGVMLEATTDPKSLPSVQARCDAFNACLDSENLWETYEAFESERFEGIDATRNCSAVRYNNNTVVYVGAFVDYMKEQGLDDVIFFCCFEIGTNAFDAQKNINKDIMRDMMTQSYRHDEPIQKAMVAAVETCPTYSPKCDGIEMWGCLLETCRSTASSLS